jgi:hypothetical protein
MPASKKSMVLLVMIRFSPELAFLPVITLPVEV